MSSEQLTYSERKKPIVDYMIDQGYKEVPFNLEHDETPQSRSHKDFIIRPDQPDILDVMSGVSMLSFRINLSVSYVIPDIVSYDRYYGEFVDICNFLNTKVDMVDTPTPLTRVVDSEGDYYEISCIFDIGVRACQ